MDTPESVRRTIKVNHQNLQHRNLLSSVTDKVGVQPYLVVLLIYWCVYDI